MVGRPHERQMPALQITPCTGSRVGLDQVQVALLGHQPAHQEDVALGLQAEPAEQVGIGRRGGWGQSVGNVVALPPVAGLHVPLDGARDHDQLVRPSRRERLAALENPPRQRSPLLPLIVCAVVRHHHAQAQHPGQGRPQRRAYGLDVQHVGPAHHCGMHHGQEGMDDRLQVLVPGRPQPAQAYALPGAAIVATPLAIRRRNLIGRARQHRDRAAQGLQPWAELLCMGFHTALHAWQASKPYPGDAQGAWVWGLSVRGVRWQGRAHGSKH